MISVFTSFQEPSSSEPAKPAKPSITKKEPPSETMSAKISLIGDLQKSFRLPGSTPNIPVKNLPVSDENDVAAENPEDHVGSILKVVHSLLFETPRKPFRVAAEVLQTAVHQLVQMRRRQTS